MVRSMAHPLICLSQVLCYQFNINMYSWLWEANTLVRDADWLFNSIEWHMEVLFPLKIHMNSYFIQCTAVSEFYGSLCWCYAHFFFKIAKLSVCVGIINTSMSNNTDSSRICLGFITPKVGKPSVFAYAGITITLLREGYQNLARILMKENRDLQYVLSICNLIQARIKDCIAVNKLDPLHM